jgi:hypothetical protein
VLNPPLSSNTEDNLFTSLRKQIEAISPILPDKAVVTIGQYTLETLMDSPKLSEEDVYTLIRVIHKKDLQHKTVDIDPKKSLVADTLYEPHYWFDMEEYYNKVDLDQLLERLIYGYHKEIMTLSNISEGASSGLLSKVHKFLAQREKSTLGIAIFPSMSHSSDALYNAFSAVGKILIDNSTPLVLIDQGMMEHFNGVHRKGDVLEGKMTIDYIVDMLLDKENIIRELDRLSRSYGVNIYSPLMATGCSLDIYDSFRNILEITLEQPLMEFDLTTATMVYVLVRVPLSYQEDFQKGRLEFEVTQWLQERIGIDIPQICEPLFVDEYGDRVDIIILVGGYDTGKKFNEVYNRIERFGKMNVDQGLVDSGEWEEIKKRMLD